VRRALGRSAGRAAALALVAAVTLALVVGTHDEDGPARIPSTSAADWSGLVPPHEGQIDTGRRMFVVLKLPSLADRVRARGGVAGDRQERRWTAQLFRAQQEFIRNMTLQGAKIDPEYRFVRVLNGFSALLDPRAVALLERAPAVEGIYPVRAAYPAGSTSRPLPASAFKAEFGRVPDVALPGWDGRGVTIALVDTAVDRLHPYLSGHVLDEIDITAAVPPSPGTPPAGTRELQRHGTQLAGILVGDEGPGGLHGIAPRASLLPIRVGSWHRDTDGEWTVVSRTDQLVGGLELAVDPNFDGDAHDAARIALIGMVEPLAAFGKGPLARAAAGAAALDTLVVAPAGNDGPAGPGFGVVSAPGGAPAALTVGAADLRRRHEQAHVVLRAGLDVVLDEVLPVAGAVLPAQPLDLALGRPEGGTPSSDDDDDNPGVGADDFFDVAGYSLVAGRAALVPATAGASDAARFAADAGASAVVLYGARVPPGAVGLDERVSVPVVSVPADAVARLRAAQRDGASVRVAIGPAKPGAATGARRVAAFSSRGLAFDGRVKPELVAPGVGLVTSQPGAYADGTGRYGTLNGSSAAAAVVAGAAALLAQARPELDAAALKGVLVGAARNLKRASASAQGAGLLDLPRAAEAEVAADPATLAFGRATRPGWGSVRVVAVRNVSSRTVRARVAVGRTGFAAEDPILRFRPRRLILRPGQVARVRIDARLPNAVSSGPPAEGMLVVTPVTGRPIRVPFAIPFGPPRVTLLDRIVLRPTSFAPSETVPAVLSAQAGRIRANVGLDELEPVERLDIELFTAEEDRYVGVIARLRNALPGVYTFAITGHDPGGQALATGDYRLRITAFPAGGGPPTRRSVRFTIQ
jgi:subtilisin family serine protease